MSANNTNKTLIYELQLDAKHKEKIAFSGFLVGAVVMGMFAIIDYSITKYYSDSIIEAIGCLVLLFLVFWGKKKSFEKWIFTIGIIIIALVIESITLSNKAAHGIIVWLTLFPFLPFFLLGEKVGLWICLFTNSIFIIGLTFVTFLVPDLGFSWIAIVSTFCALTGSTIVARIYEKNRMEMIHHLSLQATTDPLTGLSNRRGLMSTLHPLLSLCYKKQQSLCMLVMDLDHFKFVNDNYGHDVGDKIITNTANIAKSHIREGDLIARLGGEEFMIILPNTSLKEANNIAERIRKAIEKSVVDTNNSEVFITVSIGLTSTKQEKEFMSYELLFKTADEALYEAKNTGRNVVITKLYQKDLC